MHRPDNACPPDDEYEGELLEHAEPGDREPGGHEPGGRGKRVALIAAAAVAVAAVGGGAFAAASFLAGGGTQPEDVLPAGALAFAKVDMDPAANQKVAVYQLTRKFPDLAKGGTQDTALKDSVVAAMVDESGGDLSYDSDVKPWLGDRAGFAVYPPSGGGSEPSVVVAVAYTDEAAMTDALRKAGDVHWATSDGYVLLAETAAEVEGIADRAAEDPLAEQQSYVDDVEDLDGDQIAVAWVDVGESYQTAKAIEPAAAEEFLVGLGESEPSGRFAVGLHADSDYLELQGRSYDLVSGTTEAARALGAGTGGGLLSDMPADTTAALSITGLGDFLAQTWDTMAEDMDTEGAATMASELGFELPGDFPAILGAETAVAASGITGVGSGEAPRVTLRSRGGDQQRIEEVLEFLNPMLGSEGAVRATGETVVFGNDPATVEAVAAGAPGLGDTDVYRTAVPDADRAGATIFVNLGAVIDEAAQEDPDLERIKALSALGMTSTGGEDGTLRLRLTVR